MNTAEYQLYLDYRNTFSSISGKNVLKHLMKENAVLRSDIKTDNPELIGAGNCVKGIINMLCSDDDPEKSFDAIINALISVPILAHTTIKMEEQDG